MSVPRRTRQQVQAQLEREELDAEILRNISALSARLRRIRNDRLLDISDEEWQAAQDAEDELERRGIFSMEASQAEKLKEVSRELAAASGKSMDEAWHSIIRGIDRTSERMREFPDVLLAAEHFMESNASKQEILDVVLAGEDISEAQPWQALFAQLSPVGQFAHGAAMADDTSEQMTRAELTAERSRAYEKELQTQGRQVGCDQYRGQLSIGPEWVSLDSQSVTDARSITNTYNRDLARQINKIRRDVPRANRNTYAKRVRDWSRERDVWKDKQVRTQAANGARAQAQKDFYQNNGLTEGTAVLRPRTAVCPVCQGFINRGEVPVNVATGNPPPYHPSCNPAGTKIFTPVGERNIEDFVTGDVVTTRAGNCLVKQAFRRSVAEPIYRVSAGGRSLRLTGEHPVLTRDGWTHAHALKVGQEIMMVADHVNQTGDNDYTRKSDYEDD